MMTTRMSIIVVVVVVVFVVIVVVSVVNVAVHVNICVLFINFSSYLVNITSFLRAIERGPVPLADDQDIRSVYFGGWLAVVHKTRSFDLIKPVKPQFLFFK